MYVKQISVFLENTKGSLSKMTRLLADAGLDLIALSIADTEHYGCLLYTSPWRGAAPTTSSRCATATAGSPAGWACTRAPPRWGPWSSPVSYTHLDVYKRQLVHNAGSVAVIINSALLLKWRSRDQAS